jgi:hypothetical protein
MSIRYNATEEFPVDSCARPKSGTQREGRKASGVSLVNVIFSVGPVPREKAGRFPRCLCSPR